MARRLLIGIAAGLVLVTAAALTSVWLLHDSTRLKAAVENLVSAATGRTLRINGDFSMSLGRVVVVHATDIESLNPAWSGRPGMLKLRELTLAVDLWSLVARPILLTRLQASDGVLVFEWADRQFNWATGSADDDAAAPDHALPLLLEQAALDNLRLHFIHPGLTEALTVELKQANLQQDASGYMVLDIDSVFDGRAVKIAGRVGTFPQLMVAGNIDYDLTLTGLNATVNARGGLGNLARLEAPELDFRLSAPETAVLLDILNLPAITRGPAELVASVHVDGAGLAATAAGTVGEFELQSSGRVDRPGSLEGLAFDVTTSGPGAAALAGLAGIEGFPDRPYTFRARGSSAPGGLLIENLEYSMQGLQLAAAGNIGGFPALHDFDVQLDLAGENLADFSGLAAGRQLPALPFAVRGTLRDTDSDGDDDLDASLQLGKLTANITGEIADTPGFAGSEVEYSLTAENLQQLGQLYGKKLAHPAVLDARGTARIGKDRITVPRFEATLGPCRITADGSIPRGSANVDSRLGVRLQGEDFAACANLVDTGATIKLPRLPFDLATSLGTGAGRITAESGSLQLGRSRFVVNSTIRTGGQQPLVTAELTGRGASLAELLQGQGLEGIPSGAFELKSIIKVSESSGIEISNIDFSLPQARLTGSLSSDWPARPGDIRFALDASGKSLDAVLPAIPAYRPHDVAFDIHAQGEYIDGMVRIDAGRARIGSAAIDISGLLHKSAQRGVRDVRIRASGSNLSDLGSVAGQALPALPFRLSATMGGAANRIRADDAQLKVGESSLRGMFDYDATGRPHFDAELRSDFVDLNEFVSFTDMPEKAAPGKPAGDARLLSAEPLPLAWLADFDGHWRLEVRELVARNSTLQDLVIDATLSDGELVARRLAVRTPRGNLTAQLHMRPLQGGTEINAKLAATDVAIALRKMSQSDYERLPRQTIDASLTASGNSMAELGASLNGFVWMRAEGGQLPGGRLNAYMGDFLSQVLSSLNPFSRKQDYFTVDCQGIYLEAENGVLTTAPAVVYLSNQVLLTASGSIDLATEQLDLVVESQPATGLGISASELVHPFTRIAGTLSQPQLVLDPKSTLIQGSAAVATGGLTLLARGVWKRLVGSQDICARVAAEARKIRQQRDPDNVPG